MSPPNEAAARDDAQFRGVPRLLLRHVPRPLSAASVCGVAVTQEDPGGRPARQTQAWTQVARCQVRSSRCTSTRQGLRTQP